MQSKTSADTLLKLKKNINISKCMVYIIFLVVLSLFAIFIGGSFFSLNNILNIIRQTAVVSMIAGTMTFVIAIGEIDLSVGSVVGLTSLVTAWTVQAAGLIPGVLAGLAVGAVVGALNGALIAWVKIPPFIATLGTQILFAGVSRTVSGLKSVPITNMTFNFVFGGGDFGGVPVLLLWMVVIVVVGQLFLRKRPFGRQVISVGGNPKAALYSGVRVKLTIFKVMLRAGVLAAVAGILWAGRFGGGRYSLGEAEETSAIAATVLGGTSINGGKASVAGACVGAVMLGMINNALVMYGLDVYQQMVVRGLIILAAVAFTVNAEKDA